MGLFETVINDILKNKEIRKAGGNVGIPVSFRRLSEYIPVIEKATSIGILGATGSGKSRFTRSEYVYHPYKFHKETGYPLKIILFPLEDSKEKVYRNLICHYLYECYNIYINLQELNSTGKRILPDFVEEKIKEAKEFFNDFEDVVTIVDGMNTPTEIYKFCEEYALNTGIIEEYEIEIEGEIKQQSRYIANNGVHTIIVVDNMSNIDIEEGVKDEREAIVKFCKTLVRDRLCNYFKFTVIQVLQQDFASERQSYTNGGDLVISKLEPSLAGIGDSKTVSRSMHIVLGIFHPSRYGIMQYPTPSRKEPNKTYRLDILGNKFRSLSILKANDSDFGLKVPFLFEAVTEVMRELPAIGSDELQQIYDKTAKNHPEQYSKLKKAVIVEDDEEAPF